MGTRKRECEENCFCLRSIRKRNRTFISTTESRKKQCIVFLKAQKLSNSKNVWQRPFEKGEVGDEWGGLSHTPSPQPWPHHRMWQDLGDLEETFRSLRELLLSLVLQ